MIRLILSGVFEAFPNLRIIIGHWGAAVLFYLERIDLNGPIAGLPRPVSEYVRNHVWVTSSGLLSERYLRWAVEVVGADHVLCATDYPFVPAELRGHDRLLMRSGLNEGDRLRIASGNWSRLRSEIRQPLS